MKKRVVFIITILMIILSSYSVQAKDTVYVLNEHNNEKLQFLENSYNKKGQIDGIVTVGTYEEVTTTQEETKKEDQVMIIKYKKNGDVAWNYSYGKSSNDTIYDVNYTYDEENQLNGYLIVVKKTYNVVEEEELQTNTTFIKLDLDGNLVWEKDSTINKKEIINKILWIGNGYIAIGKTETDSFIVKYDKELNIEWLKEDNKNYKDIVLRKDEEKVIGYYILNETDELQEIIITNDIGELETSIQKTLEHYNTYSLVEEDNGFLLYGFTEEVKLKKGKQSYYLAKYSKEGNQEWETIGDVAIHAKENIVLKKQNNSYFLLYKNNNDSSYEVVKFKEDGLFDKKVKKIHNNYYEINNFLINQNTLYFTGQIQCPEEDNCQYEKTSLFLVSDEDKVIEVKEKDNDNILVVVVSFILIVTIIVYYHKKKGTK